MLRIDIIHEGGIWEFLRFFNGIKSTDPATTLEKLATCITNKAPAEKLGLKLAANLVFAMMHCRTASICAHYSQQECIVPTLNSGPSDIIQEMRLHLPRQKGNECSQVVKHAGSALEAFEVLCETDPEETAKTWFRPYAALIAAVIIGISGLREKTSDWRSIRVRLDRVECCFRKLKDHNPTSPILDKALSLLQSINLERGSKIPLTKNRLSSGHKCASITSSNSSTIDAEPETEKAVREERSAVKPRKRTIDVVTAKTTPTKAKRQRRSAAVPQRPNLAAHVSIEGTQTQSRYTVQPSEQAFLEENAQSNIQQPLNSHVPFTSGVELTFTESESQQNPMQLNDMEYTSFNFEGYPNIAHIRSSMDLEYPKFHIPSSYSAIEEPDGQNMGSCLSFPPELNYSDSVQELQLQSNMQNGNPTVPQQTNDSNHPHDNTNTSMHECGLNTQSDSAEKVHYFNMTAKHYEMNTDQSTINTAVSEPLERASQRELEQNEHERFTSEATQTRWGDTLIPNASAPINTFTSFDSAHPSLPRRASEPAWIDPQNYAISAQRYPFLASEDGMDGNMHYPHSIQMAEIPNHDSVFSFQQHQYHLPYQGVSLSF